MNSCFHPNTHPLWIITHQIRVTYFYLSLYSILPGPLPVFSDSRRRRAPPYPSCFYCSLSLAPLSFHWAYCKTTLLINSQQRERSPSIWSFPLLLTPQCKTLNLGRYVIIPPEINFKTFFCNKCGLLPTHKHPWKHELTPKWVAGNSVRLCRGARSKEASAIICERQPKVWIKISKLNNYNWSVYCVPLFSSGVLFHPNFHWEIKNNSSLPFLVLKSTGE